MLKRLKSKLKRLTSALVQLSHWEHNGWLIYSTILKPAQGLILLLMNIKHKAL